MRFLTGFIFSFLSLLAFAQPEKAERENVDGKRYYVHVVKPGNTMWWIHETYNVPVEEIVKANPGSEKGVSVGQRIRIPIPVETVTYTVLQKETLYGISKKFEVTVDVLSEKFQVTVLYVGVDEEITEQEIIENFFKFDNSIIR